MTAANVLELVITLALVGLVAIVSFYAGALYMATRIIRNVDKQMQAQRDASKLSGEGEEWRQGKPSTPEEDGDRWLREQLGG